MLGVEPHHGDGVAGFPTHIDRGVSSGRSVRIPPELAGGVASVSFTPPAPSRARRRTRLPKSGQPRR